MSEFENIFGDGNDDKREIDPLPRPIQQLLDQAKEMMSPLLLRNYPFAAPKKREYAVRLFNFDEQVVNFESNSTREIERMFREGWNIQPTSCPWIVVFSREIDEEPAT